MSYEERVVLAVGTQHAASASGMDEPKLMFMKHFFEHSSGGRSMLRPYSEH